MARPKGKKDGREIKRIGEKVAAAGNKDGGVTVVPEPVRLVQSGESHRCGRCAGKGIVKEGWIECPSCKGKGMITHERESLQVHSTDDKGKPGTD